MNGLLCTIYYCYDTINLKEKKKKEKGGVKKKVDQKEDWLFS